MPKKIDYQKMEKELMSQKKSCWEIWDDKIKKESLFFAEGYKKFLDVAKIEREAVIEGVAMAKKHGYKNIDDIKNLKAGDKVYFIQKEKSLILAKISRKGLDKGFKMIMAHIDSPHLDLKVNPLYEDEGIAFFKTHYYGGIKKYQWPTIALALHGVVYLASGKKIEITIGEKETEPIFMITDLLPHLDRPVVGSEQKNREVKGEDLNLVIGSMPVNDAKIKEKVKLAILEYLFDQYGMKEEDFTSAELSVVPSEKARDLGFDKTLISAYGHDDKICAYASVKSFFDAKIEDKTQICVWIDREEIGSEGSTGAKSILIEQFFLKLLSRVRSKSGMEEVYNLFSKSQAISADVSAGLDPDYKDVHDLRNAFRLGFGLTIEKYTGSGGKYFTSEASAEYICQLKKELAKNKNILFQIGGGLGKVDQGGGGTIAKYLANRAIDTVDAGVALFNMHAPLEIASKADLYCAYMSYKAFYEN
jgi:aspartyl aminopeptidase